MNILRDELKKSRNGGYEVIIYLADDQTEFAEELGKGGPDSETKASIINYVKNKYPNLKVTVAKVVLGGVVLGTIPLAGGAAHAAAAGPKDIDKASGFAKEAIVRLVESGTIQGDQTGAFNPKGTMTRDAFTSMIVKALVKDADLANPDTPTFKDVPKTHWAYKYIETAVAKGLITGTGDGTFGPTGEITREQLATILVRSLGLSADDIKGQGDTLKFADKDAISSFARDSVAFAVNNGLLTGINESTFNGKGAATREQVAVVVDRYVTNVDKLQTAADTIKNTSFKAEASDTNTIKLSFTTAVDTFAATDLTVKDKDGKDVKVTKVTLSDDKKTATVSTDALTSGASYTVTVTKDAVKGSATVVAPKAAEFKATPTGAKKIEVKFGAAIDPSAVTFTIKKGTQTVSVADKTVSADKTTVVLETTTKLTEGDYTVTATGAATADLTSKFTAANEKVDKIEFLSDVAALVDLPSPDADTDIDDIAIPYQVLNQYGENITKTTDLTSNGFTINKTDGLATLAGDYKVDQTVPLTLIYNNGATVLTANKTFTVSAEARASVVTTDGVYNVDKKVLNEDTDLSTTPFYILVDVKDQYGKTITDVAKLNAQVQVHESNSLIVDVPNGAITSSATPDNFTTVTVDGVTRTALQLKGPVAVGSNIVTLVTTTSGKSATTTVTVAEAARVNTINVSSTTEFVSAGEAAYFTVDAVDKDGNAVTNTATLNSATKGVKVTYDGKAVDNPFVFKDGAVQLRIPGDLVKVQSETSTSETKSLVLMTATNSVKTATVQVRQAAKPASVNGLKTTYSKTFKTDQTGIELSYTDLLVQDQHGRIMSDAAVAAWLEDGGSITITEATTDALSADKANNAVNFTTSTIDKTNKKITFDTSGKNTTEKVTFALSGVNNSSADVTFRTTNGSEYTSFTADTIGTVYDEKGAGQADNDAYDKVVKVYGVLADGSKVLLDNTEYTVTAPTNNTVNNDVSKDGIFDVSSALAYGDATDLKVPVEITVSAKPDAPIKQTVTFSKAAPKVVSFDLLVNDVAQTSINFDKASDFTIDSLIQGTNTDEMSIVVTDQYGVKTPATVGEHGAITFADGSTFSVPSVLVSKVSGDFTVKSNGSAANMKIDKSQLKVGDAFDVTISYVGGVTKTYRVTVATDSTPAPVPAPAPAPAP
ncbi:S-layer homology domain-containing protein [Paenibacillus aurantiacus]|uniref:S-layer homology domain-containing protein n=1 Tax=Paenibacillus aurantiacus TaxID=1936118 RepID=A0ABV5KQ91_9BACL